MAFAAAFGEALLPAELLFSDHRVATTSKAARDVLPFNAITGNTELVHELEQEPNRTAGAIAQLCLV